MISFILAELPSVIKLINQLSGMNIPDVSGVITELSGFVQRTIENLKQNEMLTDEQSDQLDAIIAAHKDQPWWKSEDASSAPAI